MLGSQSAPGAQFNQPATAGIGQTSSNMLAAPSSQVAPQPQQEKGKFIVMLNEFKPKISSIFHFEYVNEV